MKQRGIMKALKGYRGVKIVLGTVFSLWVGSTGFAFALDIRVKEAVTVREDKVTLGDIASFEPANEARCERLRMMEIASAPAPNDELSLSKHFLDYKIGALLSGEETIRLYTPQTIILKREGQTITSEKLEEIFKTHIRNRAPWPPEKIHFERISTPGTLDFPEGKIRWDIQERGNPDYLGNVYLTVSFWVEDKPLRKVSLSGRISVNRKTVKAARVIQKGEQITEGDFLLTEESSASARQMENMIGRDDALGKRARRNIQPGQRITPQMLEDPPLVKKGNRVTIKAEKASFQVTTVGKALEDGRTGDQVKVVNLSSGKEILATVNGPGVVEVDF